MGDARRVLGAGYQPRLWAKSLRGWAGGGGRPESNIAIQPSGRNLSLHMYSNTALQQYCITSLHHYIITSLHHYIITSLHHYIITSLQHYSSIALQQYSITALQHYSITALQHYSSTAVQHYRPREEIEDRSTAAVIGYARVSPREQAARGLSLAVQKAQVLAMAMLEDGGPEDVQIREDKQPRRGRGRACSRSCRLSAAGRGSPPYWATPPPQE